VHAGLLRASHIRMFGCLGDWSPDTPCQSHFRTVIRSHFISLYLLSRTLNSPLLLRSCRGIVAAEWLLDGSEEPQQAIENGDGVRGAAGNVEIDRDDSIGPFIHFRVVGEQAA
jgi:hypothetical protein